MGNYFTIRPTKNIILLMSPENEILIERKNKNDKKINKSWLFIERKILLNETACSSIYTTLSTEFNLQISLNTVISSQNINLTYNKKIYQITLIQLDTDEVNDLKNDQKFNNHYFWLQKKILEKHKLSKDKATKFDNLIIQNFSCFNFNF